MPLPADLKRRTTWTVLAGAVHGMAAASGRGGGGGLVDEGPGTATARPDDGGHLAAWPELR